MISWHAESIPLPSDNVSPIAATAKAQTESSPTESSQTQPHRYVQESTVQVLTGEANALEEGCTTNHNSVSEEGLQGKDHQHQPETQQHSEIQQQQGATSFSCPSIITVQLPYCLKMLDFPVGILGSARYSI